MSKCIIFLACLAGFLGGIAFYVGVLDRPPFEYYESILNKTIVESSMEGDEEEYELFAIMACTRSPNIGLHIGRMLQDTKDLLRENPSAMNAVNKACTMYDVPDDVDSLSIGLYFDNPSVVPEPRWGVGWIVAAPSFDDVEPFRAAVATFYEGKEDIRKVRIGLTGPGLRARIPWRTMITPMIAPMIHWNRVHTYLSSYESDPDSVFSEIYVSNKDDTASYFIDYIALVGDTSTIWEDSFPSSESMNLNSKINVETTEHDSSNEQEL